MNDHEQIRRDAESSFPPGGPNSANASGQAFTDLLAHHCLALLDELEQLKEAGQ